MPKPEKKKIAGKASWGQLPSAVCRGGANPGTYLRKYFEGFPTDRFRRASLTWTAEGGCLHKFKYRDLYYFISCSFESANCPTSPCGFSFLICSYSFFASAVFPMSW